MIHGNRSPSPWLSEFLNIKIKNPHSLLQAHAVAFPAHSQHLCIQHVIKNIYSKIYVRLD
jgi:hypothetical protein